MSKTPKLPASGGSYVRDEKGALSQKSATTRAATTKKPPATAKPAAGKKEA